MAQDRNNKITNYIILFHNTYESSEAQTATGNNGNRSANLSKKVYTKMQNKKYKTTFETVV